MLLHYFYIFVLDASHTTYPEEENIKSISTRFELLLPPFTPINLSLKYRKNIHAFNAKKIGNL